MVHAIELRDGEARYRNRWVRTDVAADLLGESPIAGQPPEVNPAARASPHTSIVSHAGKILALVRGVPAHRVQHQRGDDRALRLRWRAPFADDGPSQDRPGDRRDAVLRATTCSGRPTFASTSSTGAASSCSRRTSRSRGPVMMHDFADHRAPRRVPRPARRLRPRPRRQAAVPRAMDARVRGAHRGHAARCEHATTLVRRGTQLRVPHRQRLRRRRHGRARRRAARADVHR